MLRIFLCYEFDDQKHAEYLLLQRSFFVRELDRAKSGTKNSNVFSKMYVIYFYYLFNEERKNWYQRNFISNGAKNVSDEGTN
jgi:hypothetical protein